MDPAESIDAPRDPFGFRKQIAVYVESVYSIVVVHEWGNIIVKKTEEFRPTMAAMAVILGEKSRRTEEAEVIAQRRL